MALQNAEKRYFHSEQNGHCIQPVTDVPSNFAHVFTDKVPAYMDAPSMPSVSFRFWFHKEEIAAIHSACVCDVEGRGP